MKKYLLFAVSAMFAANVSAQGVDITPEGFKYSEMEVGPFRPDGYYMGANLQYVGRGQVPFTNEDGTGILDELGRKGLFLFCGIAPSETAFETLKPEDFIAGMSIVDLGGEVGKVLAISGVNSKINEAMQNAFEGYTGTLPLATAEHSVWNLNWTSDPDNTPLTDGTDNFRMRFVVNVFANEFSESKDIIAATYNSTAGRKVVPENVNTIAPHVKSGEFIALDEDGDPEVDAEGNSVWDPTKWLVYEFDTNAPTVEAIPIRMKMEIAAAEWHNATVFIKEIKFFQLSGEDERIPADANGCNYRKSYLTLTPNPVASVNNIEAETTAE
ncbi:MAG: hypothetical protein IKS72_02350, partial [Prevotella sp.]|nr:hypothetical protein [Prevotella sp.]